MKTFNKKYDICKNFFDVLFISSATLSELFSGVHFVQENKIL